MAAPETGLKSRQREIRKAAPRTEVRSLKQIHNDENESITMLQTGRIEFTVLDFLILNLFWPRFVSLRGATLDIRISDLFARRVGAINLR
jgi:hypothetical protein